MLYKYYAIEICCSDFLLKNVSHQISLDNNYCDGNNIRTQILNERIYVNIIKYMDEKYNINDYEKLFLTYEDAYSVLNNYCINTQFSPTNIKTTKIVEVLSIVEPPLTEIRKRKINNLL